MSRHLRRLGLAVACAMLLPGESWAQQSLVRSDDGRAELSLGGPVAGGPIRLVRIPDGDDVARVSGSGYRIEPATAILPPNSRLAIRLDSAGLPGGTNPTAISIMRDDRGTWLSLRTNLTADRQLVSPVSQPGDFAARWSPTQRCEGAAIHALDFRIGTWNYSAPGYTPGESVVTRDASQCALIDHYVDTQGGRSTSLFLLDQATGTWYNTTIDPGGRFVTRAQLETDGVSFYHSAVDREVYRHRPDGTIGFSAERSRDNGKTWSAWATATYTPAH